MTSEDFRRLALEMAGAIERSHMDHPDFRAHGRIFATLHHDDEWGMVKVTPEEQRELMRAHPAVFVPSAGAWGRQGCTNVKLAAADERTVRAAMLLAWENSAGAKVTKRAKATKGRAGRVRSSTKSVETRSSRSARRKNWKS
jgi:hypothetical protein